MKIAMKADRWRRRYWVGARWSKASRHDKMMWADFRYWTTRLGIITETEGGGGGEKGGKGWSVKLKGSLPRWIFEGLIYRFV